MHKYKYIWSKHCRSGYIKSHNKYKALKDNKTSVIKDNWTLLFKKEENNLKHIEYKSLVDIKSSYREKLLQLNNEFKEYKFPDTPIKRNEILAYIQKNLKI
ncbi:hypothetical protein [Campylobacter blaseri]|uniref:hypothetical protein n=1 Tax=Campylobacter blaseri TaxID=2042961 RepID=UPI00105736DA|nr:hypothetical protein [Campylobacter blaseri]